MIIPFRDVRQRHPHPTRYLVNSATELLHFAQQLDWYCEDEVARVQFLMISQDIIKRIENMTTELLSYKARRTFENLAPGR